MIIVTGANGQLGSATVERLLERVDPGEVGVSVRDPGRAAALAERGVRVRRGDFADPASLDEAFAGATQVLVTSVDKLGEEGTTANLAAIDAAYRAGAERVLYTSHQAAHPDSAFAPARDHAAVEAHLGASGRPFTSLRNGFYTSSLEFHLGDAVGTGELVTPAGGRVSWTERDDLAGAAAAILAGAAVFDGPTPPLTAASAVDFAEVADVLSEVTGRTVRHRVVDDEEWVAFRVGLGLPEMAARLLLGSFRAARNGEFDVTDPAMGTLLGRPPRTLGSSLAHLRQ